jgi:hypothetical protein
MKNAKTTIFGLISAIAGYFAMNGTGKLQIIGQAVSGISTFLLGASAKDADNNK